MKAGRKSAILAAMVVAALYTTPFGNFSIGFISRRRYSNCASHVLAAAPLKGVWVDARSRAPGYLVLSGLHVSH